MKRLISVIVVMIVIMISSLFLLAQDSASASKKKHSFGLPIKNNFRPTISVYYGINTLEDSRWKGLKSYHGVSLGIGAQWMWRNNGLNFDLVIIAYSKRKVGIENRVKISIGYRRAF